MAPYRYFDKASRWQNVVPLHTLQQATHVRTANWIGAVQHSQRWLAFVIKKDLRAYEEYVRHMRS